MTPPSPELLSLLGMATISLYAALKLLGAHRAGLLTRTGGAVARTS